MLRGIAGQTQWLSQQTRPDLCFGAHQLSKRSKSGATIKDLKYANAIVRKVKGRVSKVVYKKVGRMEDIIIVGFSDSDYKAGGKSTGGIVVMLGNKNSDRVSP